MISMLIGCKILNILTIVYLKKFPLPRSHLLQLHRILNDEEASENDKYVATELLKNAEVSAQGEGKWRSIITSWRGGGGIIVLNS
jgi:hypothetical protein